LGFEVSVEYLLFVHVVQREGELGEPLEDGLVSGRYVFGEAFVFVVPDLVVHVSSFAVGHHDVEAVFFDEAVAVGHDVRVSELLQDADFVLDVLAVFVGEVASEDALDRVLLVLFEVADQVDLAEAAAADRLYRFVVLHEVIIIC